MKYTANIIVLLIMAVSSLTSLPQALSADEKFVYETKDLDEEKKRYFVKLEQDKEKVDLAVINTKTLISRSKNKPYLPELYLRLAELYVEKSRIVYFIRRSVQEEAREGALEQFEANQLKQQALEIYQRILDQYSDFPDCDKVRFFMAHEFRELQQTENMLKSYRDIISLHPDSIYAPESHLLLGDYYFKQKQDVDKSKSHYESVLKYSRSPAVAVARYKLAWCQINLSDHKGALALFEESVTSAEATKNLDIDTYRRVDVRMESLIDLAFCYPEVYKKATPEEALAYFRKYAWSRPVYATVLDKLAYRYYVKKKWAIAAALYRELATLREDPEKLAEYAKNIFDSVQSLGNYEHAEKDVGIIIHALEKQKYSVHVPQEQKDLLIKDYELYARDIITHLHDKARKSKSQIDFEIAADAYKQYLDFFTGSPAIDEMAANYAEALFSADRYLEAGKQYEKTTPEATVDNQRRQEDLYSAVISYYQALKNKEKMNFYEAAFAREGLRSAGKKYASEFPSAKQTPEVNFNVAWVSYDAGDFETAIRDFTGFISTYPRHKASVAAVHLVLDAYNLMEDLEGMIEFGQSILGKASIGDTKLKKEVAQIVSAAQSKIVSGMTVSAMDDWESAREDLMAVATDNKSSAMGEQALNALILSSKDKNDLETLFSAGNQLMSAYPKSTQIKTTLGILIDTSIKTNQFRLLVDNMEEFVRRFPDDENASGFLLQTAQIREGMGQYAAANKIYRRILSSGKTSPQMIADLTFSFAENAEKIDDLTGALAVLQSSSGKLSSTDKVRAQALMAALSFRNNRRSQAMKYAKIAKKNYKNTMGEKDPVLLSLMAEIAYNEVYHSGGPYFALQLKGKIENAVVTRKTDMLAKLENGYQKVMAFKSPDWVLKSCFRANEINREYANFLINAPLPDGLTADQKKQYQTLINQKAQAYLDKAGKYVQTCVEMARKWEICDPQLAGYFIPADNPDGREGVFKAFSANRPSTEIGIQSLADETLSALYQQLLKTPDDYTLHLKLAKAYLAKRDYQQAGLVAKNTLSKIGNKDPQLKAGLLQVVGLYHFNSGHDTLAKESFAQALDINSALAESRNHLIGIYRHYDHQAKVGILGAEPSTSADQGEQKGR